MAKSEPIEMDAVVTMALPNAMFRLRLEQGGNTHEILGMVSGKMRKHFIRILPGDKVAGATLAVRSDQGPDRLPAEWPKHLLRLCEVDSLLPPARIEEYPSQRRDKQSGQRIFRSNPPVRDRHERFLRDIDPADALHALLAFLLLFQQLAFRLTSPP